MFAANAAWIIQHAKYTPIKVSVWIASIVTMVMFHKHWRYFRTTRFVRWVQEPVIGDYMGYQIKLKDGTSFLANTGTLRKYTTTSYRLITIMGLGELLRMHVATMFSSINLIFPVFNKTGQNALAIFLVLV